MVSQYIWIAITVGVFFVGLGGAFAIMQSSTPGPMTMQQMMGDPQSRQQMMNQMMQDPQMMQDMKQNTPMRI